jgi:NhaP-type Na+/H+ or K+/H+ antiporter
VCIIAKRSAFDEFLALGLIALACGVALLVHALGFVAVFAAGLALRRIEEQSTRQSRPTKRCKRQAMLSTDKPKQKTWWPPTLNTPSPI